MLLCLALVGECFVYAGVKAHLNCGVDQTSGSGACVNAGRLFSKPKKGRKKEKSPPKKCESEKI